MNPSDLTFMQRRFVAGQRGAVLLVSLIILLILTIIGVSSISSSGLQNRMAANAKDRLIAFEGAEAGLAAGERYLENHFFSSEDFGVGCTAPCFEPTCADGLCFTGTYIGAPLYTCLQNEPAIPIYSNPVLDVFSDANSTSVELTSSVMSARVKYIIEFRCIVKGSLLDLGLTTNPHYLFRITSYAESPSGKGRAMLQAEYKRDVDN